MNICIVASNFYPKITKMLINGTTKKLKAKGYQNFKLISVPGTYEIPVVVSNFIDKYDSFIVLGCVIKGKTDHYDFLCSSVFNNLTTLSINSKKPIVNGILTCKNIKQAIERADIKKKDKGGDVAEALITLYKTINYE